METKLMEIDEDYIKVSQGAVLEFTNFKKLKAELENIVKEYKTFVVDSPENFIKSKKDVAYFRKLDTAFDNVIKKVKKELLKPLAPEVLIIEKLKAIYNKTLVETLKKNDGYDLKLKENKKELIENIFSDFKAEYPSVDFMALDKIMDVKWLLKGTKIKAITNEIESEFKYINSDVQLINLEGELGARIKTKYLKNGFNFVDAKTKVLSEVARETKDQEQIKASMEEKGLIINKDLNTPIQSVKSSVIKEPKVSIKEVQTMDFRVTGDKEILQEIVQFMRTKDVQLQQLKGEN